MMTLQEAIAKAEKLIRLSASSEPHEAALAAQRAQEILARYEIDRATLDIDGNNAQPDEPISREHDMLDGGVLRLATWKVQLASTVSRVNACRIYTHGSDICIVGRASDVAKVRYLYRLLASEVERLTAQQGRGQGRSYANSFRMGCTSAIQESLRAAQQRVADEMRAGTTDTTALARIDNALQRMADKDRAVDAWIRAHMNLRSSSRSYSGNGNGFAAGHRAGQTVNVGGNRLALGTGQRRLGK